VALGIEGGIPGLVSCAGSGGGPAIEAAIKSVKAQVLMQLQLSPEKLEAVGAIQRNAILPIIA
jgi:hypothetical protein